MVSIFYMGKREGKAEGYKQAIEETTIKRLQAVVYIDPRPHGAYDQPPPVTDPALLAHIQERKRQEALQAEIMKEQQRQEAMKAFVAKITGQDEVLTNELPAMTGDLRRKWQTGKLKPVTLTKPTPTQKLDPDDGSLL